MTCLASSRRKMLLKPALDPIKEKDVIDLAATNALCVNTQSHAQKVKIPITYYEAPDTKFRLF